VIKQTQVVPDFARLHELTRSFGERDVERRRSTSNGAGDIAGET